LSFCFSIDATTNSRLGRFVNDSALQETLCNARAVAMILEHLPRILFFARKEIAAGSEIRFDYQGEDMPWREVRY